MTHIFDIYNFIRFVCDKDGKGQPSTDEAGRALDAGQTWLFNRLREPNTLNNITPAALDPFVVQFPFTTNSVGLLAKPANHCQTQRIVVDDLEYTPILQNELLYATKSSLRPIAQFPRYYGAGSSIILYPGSSAAGMLTYLKTPATPVIGKTINSDNEPVYDAATSVQLEFNKDYWGDIINYALKFIGVSTSNPDVLALSQAPA